jgi:hypothetical protein
MKEFILVLALLVSAPSVVPVNAPGGAYIQCDLQNPIVACQILIQIAGGQI